MTNKTFTAPLSIKDLDESGEFTGYASVYGNTDLQGDRVVPIAKRPSAGGGAAEAAQIEPDHSVARREGGNLRVPHPAVGDAGVHEQERLAAAGFLPVEAGAGRGRVSRRPSRCRVVCHASLLSR